jgi:hypothetical protein
MENILRLEQQAIDAAINANWQEAINLNKKIITLSKKNIDAYLRLGFAYLQKGKVKEAKKFYRKTLKLQPGNHLITEYLERIKVLESKKITQVKTSSFNPFLFIDIAGITKTVALVNCGQKSILAKLSIGQEVILVPKKRKVEIRSKEKEYIGCLPDDLSKRLRIFIKAGSIFTCYIKESTLKTTVVFLKEEKKGKRVAKYAAFPINLQANLSDLRINDEDSKEEEIEEISDFDLEKLAETLTNDDKYYLPYEPEDKEEVEE